MKKRSVVDRIREWLTAAMFIVPFKLQEVCPVKDAIAELNDRYE